MISAGQRGPTRLNAWQIAAMWPALATLGPELAAIAVELPAGALDRLASIAK